MKISLHIRRLVLALVILGSIGFAIWRVNKLRINEDIVEALPQTAGTEALTDILAHFGFANKLVVSVKSHSAHPSPDALIDFANTLHDSLLQNFEPYISTITLKTDFTAIQQVQRTLLEYLPVFLDTSDYQSLETAFAPEAIAATLTNARAQLLSPAGAFFKEQFVADPLGLSYLPLKKLAALSQGTEYVYYRNYIFSADTSVLLLFVNPVYPSSETRNNSIFIEKLRQTIDELETAADNQIDVSVYGGTLVALSNATQVKRDILYSMLIAIIGIVLLLGLYFKRASVFLLIVAPMVLGALGALAVLSFTTESVSIIALAMGSVLLGVTVEYTLHIYNHLRHAPDRRTLMGDIALPLLISCITTVVAFLCLALLDSPLLADLGWFAGLSVLFAGVFSLLFIPVVARPGSIRPPSERIDGWFKSVASRPLHTNWAALALVLGLTVVFIFTFRYVRIETDLYHLSYMSDEITKAEQELAKISSFTDRNIYVIARETDFYTAIGHLQRVKDSIEGHRFEQFFSPATVVPSTRLQNLRLARWEAFWTPERRRQVMESVHAECQRLGFGQRVSDSIAGVVHRSYAPLPARMALEMSKSIFSELVNATDDKIYLGGLIKVKEKDRQALIRRIEGAGQIFIADRSVMASKLAEYLRNDFQRLMNFTLVAAFLIIFLSFGRIELTLVTLVPMLISGLWISGTMGLAGVTFNVFNLIIISLVFGLGIDYSIFISMGMVQDRVTGGNRFLSYKTSILLSALTTLIGIGALSVARHPALRSIGTLSIIGIGSVVLLSFTLQPALFRLFVPVRTTWVRSFPRTFTDLFFSVTGILIFVAGCLVLSVGGAVLPVLPMSARSKKLAYHYLIWLFASIVVYGNPQVPKRKPNYQRADFKKPCIIIANHQSYLDIMLLLSLHPRISMMTADWVQHSPIFGYIVRKAGFAKASDGYLQAQEHIGKQLLEGYSVVIFPEGTRSTNLSIQRFHKGAFYLAEQLGTDIQPIVISGSGYMVSKGDVLMRMGYIILHFLPRYTPAMQLQMGTELPERAKAFRKLFSQAYTETDQLFRPVGRHRKVLMRNYLYFNPALEWYVRIKTRLEDNYLPIHRLLPEKGKILDLGCGYGMMSFMLRLLSPEREITGIDFDEKKITVAKASPLCTPGIQFIHADITTFDFGQYDAILLTDVLHYLPLEKQQLVLDQCLSALRPGGLLIVRDGDTSVARRHTATRLTEYLSTRLMKFNKTVDNTKQLHFFSQTELTDYLTKKGVITQKIQQSRVLSNVLLKCYFKTS